MAANFSGNKQPSVCITETTELWETIVRWRFSVLSWLTWSVSRCLLCRYLDNALATARVVFSLMLKHYLGGILLCSENVIHPGRSIAIYLLHSLSSQASHALIISTVFLHSVRWGWQLPNTNTERRQTARREWEAGARARDSVKVFTPLFLLYLHTQLFCLCNLDTISRNGLSACRNVQQQRGKSMLQALQP